MIPRARSSGEAPPETPSDLRASCTQAARSGHLRDLPFVERKAKLRKLIPRKPSSVLYLDHIKDKGVELFEQCCKLDLEGVVAKPKLSPYRELGGKPMWVKVKNPGYTQAEGSRELFNQRR